MKIAFLGAGSTVFAKNVLGDCLLAEYLPEFEIALLDIDAERLEESYVLICALRDKYKPAVTVKKYITTDEKQLEEGLAGASYVINAIQVGGYEPCTVTDFDIADDHDPVAEPYMVTDFNFFSDIGVVIGDAGSFVIVVFSDEHTLGPGVKITAEMNFAVTNHSHTIEITVISEINSPPERTVAVYQQTFTTFYRQSAGNGSRQRTAHQTQPDFTDRFASVIIQKNKWF